MTVLMLLILVHTCRHFGFDLLTAQGYMTIWAVPEKAMSLSLHIYRSKHIFVYLCICIYTGKYIYIYIHTYIEP